jgi:ABC-type sugar transport system ATPase subunit
VTRDHHDGDGSGQPASPVPLLALRSVSKTFPGVRALDDVSLEIHAGEVHMLLGENGAGKSSLIKVLYGAYRADTGTILFEGKPVEIARPADARRLGIAVSSRNSRWFRSSIWRRTSFSDASRGGH